MSDFTTFESLFSLSSQTYLLICLSLLGSMGVCSVLIALYGKENKDVVGFLKNTQIVLIKSILFCLFNFVFCIWLYGYGIYAWYIFVLLCGFYVLSYIDCLLLKIPDLLNFSVFLIVFSGLYYLDSLTQESVIAALSVAGAFALLRMFGSFVFQKEIMGEADIVVLASMGAVVGLYWSIYLVLFSCIVAMSYILIVGLIHLKEKQISIRQIRIPFALFLQIGFVLSLLSMKFSLLEKIGV